MVRAKFKVTEHRQYAGDNGKEIVLQPQYDESIEEDRRFAKYTPTGRFAMRVDNPLAVEQLALGRTFYLDLTPVE